MKSKYQINIVRSVTKKQYLALSLVFCLIIQCFTGVKSNEIDVATGYLLTGVLNPASATITANSNNVSTVNNNISRIATGLNHTCVLFASGTVRCWGRYLEGQLGSGESINVNSNFIFASNNSNNNNANSASNLNLSNVTAISSVGSHTCSLFNGGTIRCWGLNSSGGLGIGNLNNNSNASTLSNVNIANVSAIATGYSHTCVLLTGGSIRCWGGNDSGQLGIGNTSSVNNANNVSNLNLSNVTSISSGGSHTCALFNGGTVRCWGLNSSDQLGIGTQTNVNNAATSNNLNLSNVSAIATGDSHTCVLFNAGTVRCWGLNTSGQLGIGNTNNISNAVNANNLNLSNVSAIATGGSHTCALFNAGTVRCWGRYLEGQLGSGESINANSNSNVSSNNTNVTNAVNANNLSLTNVSAISTGNAHTCILFNTGTIRCWGLNGSGQLGIGNNNNNSNSSSISNISF